MMLVSRMIDVSLVIPMHNEADAVAPLFAALPLIYDLVAPRWSMEVVLIDDGSSDGTYDLAWQAAEHLRFPAKVIRVNPREGLGGALRHGFQFAVGDVLVTYDADLPYPLEDVPRLLTALQDGADLVTASPYHPDGGVEDVSQFRLFLSRLASAAYRRRLGAKGAPFHTFTCGFRAYRRVVLDQVKHQNNGFLATAELLVRALESGFRVVEVPSVLRSRKQGASKMRAIQTTWDHLRFLWKLRKTS